MNEFLASLRAGLDFLEWEKVSLLVGFVSAWLLFELTERRRVRLAQRELRRALVAELENAEVVVSVFVAKYARFCQSSEDVAVVAGEIRWFLDIGRHRLRDVGVLSDLPSIPPDFKRLSDNELVALHSTIKETIGTKMIMPIVEKALAGPTSGFSAQQIQALSTLRWQAHLLNQDADSMKEMLLLTFSVADETNHKIVVANHDQRSAAYGRRAQTLLRALRAALLLLR